jgi:hypothetical protein
MLYCIYNREGITPNYMSQGNDMPESICTGRLSWEVSKNKYGSGRTAKLGKWAVADTCYDMMLSRDDTTTGRFKLTCHLPGIKKILGNYQTEEEAMKRGEEVVCFWINASGVSL